MSGRSAVAIAMGVVVLVLAANLAYRPTENTWLSAPEHEAVAMHRGADQSALSVAVSQQPKVFSDERAKCALTWRPGLVPRVPPSSRTAWLGAAGRQRDRLDRFFAKLLRGEKVTLYFLGESVTRGSGADHTCLTCSRTPGAEPPDVDVHRWIDRRVVGDFDEACAPPPDLDSYKRCSRVEGTNDCPANATVCFPRNSWRCLMIHWLENAFPGQIEFRISAKPLLFMASCFARSLANIDLIVHEYAVNGGGRMLCLQERIIRAALLGAKQPAVLMLLWMPKHYRPPPPVSIMTQVQDGLRSLGVHYNLPTLCMTEAFKNQCAANETWCYTRDLSLGGQGFLHADMYHPNRDGHAYFAAHIVELLERTLTEAIAANAATADLSQPLLSSLPKPLHELNRGLDNSAEGGKNLCLGVDEMESLARVNRGWQQVTEMTKAGVKRLPALQTDAAESTIEWTLDVRGVIWLIITYMQSYAGFAAADVQCVSGCTCTLHAHQASADVDGVSAEDAGVFSRDGHNIINATHPKSRTSEPQWRILDLAGQTERCKVRITTRSPGKFKLMLLSLIRVGNVAEGSTSTRDAQQALMCFGVHDSEGSRGHGMIKTGERLRWDNFGLDETYDYTKDH